MLIFSVSFQCERMLLERIHIKSGPNDPNADDDGNDDSYGGDDWRQRQNAQGPYESDLHLSICACHPSNIPTNYALAKLI